MNGEALLGPLPSGFEMKRRWHERDGRSYYVVLNSDTGSFQAEDPRLSQIPLPIGCRIADHEEKEWWTWFVNDITGKRTCFDSRLTFEALKQRGVDMRKFDLI